MSRTAPIHSGPIHSAKRRLATLLLGTVLAAALAAPVALVPTASVSAAEAPDLVYGQAHVEAALSEALSSRIPIGRLQLELDNRAVELRAPAGAGSLRVDNLFYSPIQDRFAAEIVVSGTSPEVRLPVSGRAYGVVQVPVLSRRVVQGDSITPDDIDWVDVRAEQTGSDIAATDAQLIGMTPRRGIPLNQPVRLRDLQTPRLIDKGALVTITLTTENLALSAQGKALQDGGKGDVIRVVNTQSNRIVEATVAGPNLVAVAKPGVIAK